MPSVFYLVRNCTVPVDGFSMLGDGSSGAILVVDDSDDDVELLKRGLKELQLSNPVSRVKTGAEAIALLEGQKPYNDRKQYPIPSVIFLDLKLPDVSGFEVMAWISGQPSLRRMLVVIHSGFATTDDIKALYRAGANTFLHKAGDTSELRNLVNSFSVFFKGDQKQDNNTGLEVINNDAGNKTKSGI